MIARTKRNFSLSGTMSFLMTLKAALGVLTCKLNGLNIDSSPVSVEQAGPVLQQKTAQCKPFGKCGRFSIQQNRLLGYLKLFDVHTHRAGAAGYCFHCLLEVVGIKVGHFAL